MKYGYWGEENGGYGHMPLFAKFGVDNSTWGSILEKAFAKYHGNYIRLESGSFARGMTVLNGSPDETIYHHYGDYDEEKDRVWNLLNTYDSNDHRAMFSG